MNTLKVYEFTAQSRNGRLPAEHRDLITADFKEEALLAIMNRWPDLYNVKIKEKTILNNNNI